MNDGQSPEFQKPTEGIQQIEEGVRNLENLSNTLDRLPPAKQIGALEEAFGKK